MDTYTYHLPAGADDACPSLADQFACGLPDYHIPDEHPAVAAGHAARMRQIEKRRRKPHGA